MRDFEFSLDKKVGIAVALAAVTAGFALVLKIRNELALKEPVPKVEYDRPDSYSSGTYSSRQGSDTESRSEVEREGRLLSSGASPGFIRDELGHTEVGGRLLRRAQATFGSNPTPYQISLMRRRR